MCRFLVFFFAHSTTLDSIKHDVMALWKIAQEKYVFCTVKKLLSSELILYNLFSYNYNQSQSFIPFIYIPFSFPITHIFTFFGQECCLIFFIQLFPFFSNSGAITPSKVHVNEMAKSRLRLCVNKSHPPTHKLSYESK